MALNGVEVRLGWGIVTHFLAGSLQKEFLWLVCHSSPPHKWLLAAVKPPVNCFSGPDFCGSIGTSLVRADKSTAAM